MAMYTRGSFQFIDHTADVGIMITAPTLGALFEVAAVALAETITDADALAHRVKRQFRLQEDELETLLVSWLQELLYLLDTEGLLFGRFEVDVRDSRLAATAWGDFFDAEIHPMKTEIKAVTYHQLRVVKSDKGWEAQMFFDL